MSVGRVVQYLKDCLFPVFCLGCKQEGQWWCDKCLLKVEVGVFCCPVCHSENNNGQACEKCKAVNALNGVAAFFNYDEQSTVGQLIKQFKYQFAYDINQVWKKVIDLYLEKIIFKMGVNSTAPVIIPVPLHQKRQRERGFNQAELIAKSVYDCLNKNWSVTLNSQGLQRQRFTKQQAKLTRPERIKNLTGAFVWKNQQPPGKNIILIDDVYTSGSTMNECAVVLKKAGANKVFGLTIARD